MSCSRVYKAKISEPRNKATVTYDYFWVKGVVIIIQHCLKYLVSILLLSNKNETTFIIQVTFFISQILSSVFIIFPWYILQKDVSHMTFE